MWGIVYTESAGTGFAMEFVGDMQDSMIGGSKLNTKPGLAGGPGIGSHLGENQLANQEISRKGRGIN